MIKQFLKKASVKNAGWLIIGRVGQMVVSLIVGILTARYLGPSNYGLINYATAYTAFFMAFCTLGINSVLVKEFIDYPDEEGEIIGTSLLLRAVSSILSAVIIVLIVSVLNAGESTTIVVVCISSLSLIFHVFESINYWFQAKLQSKVTAIVLLAAYTITSLYKIVLLYFQKSVIWFAFSTSMDYMLVGIFLLYSYKKYGGKRLAISKAVGSRILRKSVHFMLPSIMVSIYGYVDKFMLKHMLSESEVGYYATATAICGMWTFVLNAVIDSMYPAIMESYKIDKQLYEKKNRQLYMLVFYFAMIVSLFFCLCGDWVVLLLYGFQYERAIMPLKVITWYTAFSYLGGARNAWIVCENMQKYLKYIYVSAAVSNVFLNMVFIPFWGPTGAAVASLITQIITTMIAPFFIEPLRHNTMLMIEGICFKGIK